MSNPKLQIPNPNHSQIPTPKLLMGVSWELGFGHSLGFGSWEWLGFGAWSLGFDCNTRSSRPPRLRPSSRRHRDRPRRHRRLAHVTGRSGRAVRSHTRRAGIERNAGGAGSRGARRRGSCSARPGAPICGGRTAASPAPTRRSPTSSGWCGRPGPARWPFRIGTTAIPTIDRPATCCAVRSSGAVCAASRFPAPRRWNTGGPSGSASTSSTIRPPCLLPSTCRTTISGSATRSPVIAASSRRASPRGSTPA